MCNVWWCINKDKSPFTFNSPIQPKVSPWLYDSNSIICSYEGTSWMIKQFHMFSPNHMFSVISYQEIPETCDHFSRVSLQYMPQLLPAYLVKLGKEWQLVNSRIIQRLLKIFFHSSNTWSELPTTSEARSPETRNSITYSLKSAFPNTKNYASWSGDN